MKLFDKTLTQVERALDVRLARQNVLAGNLANVDTPGYTPRDVDFGASLAAAQGTANARTALPASAAPRAGHLPVQPGGSGGPSNVTLVQSNAAVNPGLDGNGVDLDRTMTDLAQNALQYGAAARAAQKKLALLRLVASDGQA